MLPHFNLLGVKIFTYPLMLGIIWGLSFNYSQKLLRYKSENFPSFTIYFIGAFLCAWLGAKGLFLLTLQVGLYERALSSLHFWLGGGFVFYGGLIAGFVFTAIFSRIKNVPIKKFSFVIPVLALGHGLGRVGCFLAGCCFGSSCDLPWAISIAGELRHPTQLYEAFLLFGLSYILLLRFKKDKPLILYYFVSYAVIRFGIEIFRGDEIRGHFGPFSTSQLVSVLILLCCIVYKIRKVKPS